MERLKRIFLRNATVFGQNKGEIFSQEKHELLELEERVNEENIKYKRRQVKSYSPKPHRHTHIFYVIYITK